VAGDSEGGCACPATGAMKSGSSKAAMSSVTITAHIVKEDVIARYRS